MPARHPQHGQIAALNFRHRQHRKIGWLNQLAASQQLPLNLVKLIAGYAHGRKHRLPASITILPDHPIAATQMLEIIGEGAHRAQHRVRVPARLVFDALALDVALAQQVLLELAVAGSSHFVVTRNLRHDANMELKFPGLQIVNPATMMKELST